MDSIIKKYRIKNVFKKMSKSTVSVASTIMVTAFALSGCQQMADSSHNRLAHTQVSQVGKTVQLEVSPTRVACQVRPEVQCLQVTEVKTGRNFQLWYNAIDGFDHASGFRYRLTAQPVGPAPVQDPSAQQWVLEKVISQRPS